MRSIGAAVVLALAGVLACAEEGLDPETAMAETWAKAVCEAEFAHGCDCPESQWSLQAQCDLELHQMIREWQVNAIAAGTTYDQDCFERHLDNIAELGCELASISDAEPERCLIHHGSRGLGEPCLTYGPNMSDCEQGLICSITGSTCQTPEMPYVEVGLGEPCVDEMGWLVAFCTAGLACDQYGSHTCVTPAAIGEPCPGNFPCADGWCDMGTCAAREPTGAACNEYVECVSFDCSDGVCAEPLDPPISCYALGF